MKKNMGTLDRVVRVLIAVIIFALYFMQMITGTLGVVLLVLAGVFVLTSIISFCPLYLLVGLSTCGTKK